MSGGPASCDGRSEEEGVVRLERTWHNDGTMTAGAAFQTILVLVS
jgi:hypothetical protein